MKKGMAFFSYSAVALALASASACSTLKGEKEGGDVASTTGPVVVDSKIQPSTIELDRKLQPMQRAQVTAEVKDFQSEVTDVKLRFSRIPMEVPLKHLGGSTWEGEISPAMLKKLAVGNQKTAYEANIIAKNAKGEVAVGQHPIEVVVRAPELTTASG